MCFLVPRNKAVDCELIPSISFELIENALLELILLLKFGTEDILLQGSYPIESEIPFSISFSPSLSSSLLHLGVWDTIVKILGIPCNLGCSIGLRLHWGIEGPKRMSL